MSIGTISNVSTGRGGAGNMRSSKPKPTTSDDADLETPTIKNQRFTTGRGGSGNIVSGDSKKSREAQDLEPVKRKDAQVESTVLTGRGGAGNKHKVMENEEGSAVLEDEEGLGKVNSQERPKKERGGSFVGRALEKMGSGRRRGSKESRASVGSASTDGVE